MASKKDLKKDINFLTEEIVETCFLHYYLKQNKDEERANIDSMIEETIQLRNEIMFKINNPAEELKGPKLKAFYSELLAQMMTKTDETFEKLGKLDK